MNRIEKIKHEMQVREIDCIILFSSRNIFYTSNTAQFSICLIPLDSDPMIFVKRNFERGKQETWIKNIVQLNSTQDVIREIKSRNLDNGKIGIEMDFVRVNQFLKLKKDLNAEFVDINPLFSELRMIKERSEIDCIKKAAKAVVNVQKVCREMLRPGITELEVAAEVSREAKINGSWSPATNFYWDANGFVLASGENLYTPEDYPILSGVGASNATPRSASHRVLKEGDIFVLDFATNVEGYHADHARTYFIGKPPEKYKKLYKLVYKAIMRIESQVLVGKEIGVLFKEIKQRVGEYQEYFQGFNGYRQGLGHGVGLELDEPPAIVERNIMKFQENMVLAFEPKLIIPSWGAIDFEDTVYLRPGATEVLTNSPFEEY
ncbi:MAG TPA: Xaa-Pro peptidase family protein [Candidatus Deferrimicrobium sp.]|nr:Xaa-Pro peptidase family protein [Candidatus Deferrimicrobium sp.]